MGADAQTKILGADQQSMDMATQLRDAASRGMSGHLDAVSIRLSGQIWLREGRVCTVSLSSATPALGMRLVSGGKLSLNSLGTALATQKQNPAMRLGDVLVRLGLVTRQDVEAIAWEQMCDGLATLLDLRDVACTFTAVPATSCPPAGPTVEEVIAAAQSRASRWQEVVRQVGGSDTVAALTDDVIGGQDMTLRPEEWAVLCRIDGRRTLASIADQAGFTILEGASILQSLLAAGLVTVPQVPLLPAPEPPPVAAPMPATAPAPTGWTSKTDLFDDPSDLLRELSELGGAEFSGRRHI